MKKFYAVLILFFTLLSCEDSLDNTTNDTTFTVSFNTEGGSYIAPIDVVSGSCVTRPVNPTLEGYTFNDWYNSSSLLTLWDFDTPIVEDVTIYAKWYVSPIVTFNSNGGSEISNQVVNYNTAITEPTEPTRTDYTFGGWYIDPLLTCEWDFTTKITEDIALYAKWINSLFFLVAVTDSVHCSFAIPLPSSSQTHPLPVYGWVKS